MSLCGMTPYQIATTINIYGCIGTAIVVFAMNHWHCKHEKKESYDRGYKDGRDAALITKENWHMSLPEYPEVEAQFDEKHAPKR
jgi:hypothetical protein